MPMQALHPNLSIPNVDLWTFLFERRDKPFPDDKGMINSSTNAFLTTARELIKPRDIY
jgi:hypothetical protein